MGGQKVILTQNLYVSVWYFCHILMQIYNIRALSDSFCETNSGSGQNNFSGALRMSAETKESFQLSSVLSGGRTFDEQMMIC